MGEIVALMELENTIDRDNASDGAYDESAVRRVTAEGVVDTSAVMLAGGRRRVPRLRMGREVMGPMPTSTDRKVRRAGDGVDRQPPDRRHEAHPGLQR